MVWYGVLQRPGQSYLRGLQEVAGFGIHHSKIHIPFTCHFNLAWVNVLVIQNKLKVANNVLVLTLALTL